jgi:hypothetical protein
MADATFERATGSRMRHNRGWLALGSVPWMIGLGCVVAALVTGVPAFLAGLFHLGIFGLVGLGLAYKRNPHPRFVSGAVKVDAEGLHFGGLRVAGSQQIKQGFVVPGAGRCVVRIVRKGLRSSVNIVVKDVAEGRELLRALGLDASQTVAEVRGMSRIFSLSTAKQMLLFVSPAASAIGGALLGGLTFGPKGVIIAPLLMVAALVTMMTLIFARTKIQIGADGILTRWLGKERFISFSEIADVSPCEIAQLSKTYVGVELTLHGGERVRLLVGQKQWDGEEASILYERIREAGQTYRAGGADADASVLARNGRPSADWIAVLRSIGAGANAGMRTPPIPTERLWRIVEDVGASALARAGAAVALAPQVSGAERKRIRVAAKATASPKLHVALERASDVETSDEELAQALAELEEDAAADAQARA